MDEEYEVCKICEEAYYEDDLIDGICLKCSMNLLYELSNIKDEEHEAFNILSY